MEYELFSKRQQRIQGETPDTFQYETIPKELRFQVLYIWEKVWEEAYYNDYFGAFELSELARDAYNSIEMTLREEYGVQSLGEQNDFDGEIDDPYQVIYNFLLETEDTDKVIDVIEVSFRYIDQEIRDKFYVPNDDELDEIFGPRRRDIPYDGIPPDEAIDLLNRRFREHSVECQYKSGQIVKGDSPDIHSEVVKPAEDGITELDLKDYDRSEQSFQIDVTDVLTDALLPKRLLHHVVSEKVLPIFMQGSYGPAVFEAFKQVEVTVREAGGYTEPDYGTKLMRMAFNPENGALTDPQDMEKQARSDLFAGAIGSYKNPGSHRDVEITAEEGAGLIVFASHLLRIVDSRSQSDGDWQEQFANGFARHLKNSGSPLMDPQVFMGEDAQGYPKYIGFNIKKIENLDIRDTDAFWLVASTIHDGKIYLKLYINDSNYFDQLESQKAAIQREFGEQLKWEYEYKPHRIGVDIPVKPLDKNRGQWNQHFENMREKLEKLNKIFLSRIKEPRIEKPLSVDDDIPF